MRLAILSDIHGNSVALDAVLADIQRAGGVDGYWVLGDLAALGPDPIGSLERVAALPNCSITRGNSDDDLLRDEIPGPSPVELAQNPTRVSRFVQVAASFAWTQGTLAATTWFAWLDCLPLEVARTLPDGTRLLGVHASPGQSDGEGIHPRQTQAAQRELLAPASADVIFVGHTHWAMDVMVDQIRVVNLGSISLPVPPNLHARYTLLTADSSGYQLEHRSVDYDRAAVIAAMRRVHNPGAALVERYLTGQQRQWWSSGLTAAEAERLGLPIVLVDPAA